MDDASKTAERNLTPRTTGAVLHRAARYDLLLWLVTLGRERVYREKVLRLARLEPVESVLDVGCGTGTLAIMVEIGWQRCGSGALSWRISNRGRGMDHVGAKLRRPAE